MIKIDNTVVCVVNLDNSTRVIKVSRLSYNLAPCDIATIHRAKNGTRVVRLTTKQALDIYEHNQELLDVGSVCCIVPFHPEPLDVRDIALACYIGLNPLYPYTMRQVFEALQEGKAYV